MSRAVHRQERIFFQAILVANHHAERARADAGRLDRLLGAILDPAGRELTWGALVRDHGWPDEDLEALRVADF